MKNYFASMAVVLMQTRVQTRKDLEVCCSKWPFFVISKPDMSHLNSRECVVIAGQWFAGSRSRI